MVSSSVTLSERQKIEALQLSERPVRKFDHSQLQAVLAKVRWDDLHTFHDLASQPSIRKAARSLGIAPNTIRARITRLEHDLGTLLFLRDREGLHLTVDGEMVVDVARDMRSHSAGLPFGNGNHALVNAGQIRICASEGLGTFWLTPRLPKLKAQVPDLVVALDSYSNQDEILPARHDVAVGFARPTDPDLIVARLGFVHMIPFASEDYIRRRGAPCNFEDAIGHDCIQQEASGLNYDALRLFMGDSLTDQLVNFRVSSSYSLFWAIASGLGIGALPTYIRSLSRKVIPVPLPIQLKFEIWMSYNRGARDSVPLRAAVNWLRSCFDPQLFPWFGEEFVHPDQFNASYEDSQVIPLFDHLIDGPA